MKLNIYISYLILPLVVLTSCTDVIDVKLNDEAPILVVDGSVTYYNSYRIRKKERNMVTIDLCSQQTITVTTSSQLEYHLYPILNFPCYPYNQIETLLSKKKKRKESVTYMHCGPPPPFL